MKILNIIKSFNEIEFLPYAVEFYQANSIDIYVLDFCSTDGSSDWLARRRIPYEKIDDQDEDFTTAKQRIIEKLSPDWVITSHLNEYIVTPSLPLAEIVRLADEKGVNLIKCRRLEFYHTGEEVRVDHPKNTFFYYKEEDSQNESILIRKVSNEEALSCVIEGFILCYKNTKIKHTVDIERGCLVDVRNFEPLRKFINGS